MAKPPSEDIDPRRVDVATSPRMRRVRAKPEPSEELKATKPARRARALKRPHTPAVMFEPLPNGDGYEITSPHADLDLWELQLADAFSTRSAAVLRAFVDQLKDLCERSWDMPNQSWKPDETQLSAILAMVADANPKTIAQAALVAQSIAVHLLAMRLAKDASIRAVWS